MRRNAAKRGRILLAAISSGTLAGWSSGPAQADLTIDLRAVSVTGGGAISNGGKFVQPNSAGVTVVMGVFARVSGTNSVQNITDINGDGSELVTWNDDTLISLVGSFQSVGPLKGNMAPVAGPIRSTGFNTGFTPFNVRGWQNGTAVDWDSDGDLDIGALHPGVNPDDLFIANASPDAAAAKTNASSPGIGFYQNGSFTPNTSESLINASTGELRIGTIRFIVAGTSGAANINFVLRDLQDSSAANWFEDGSTTGKNPSRGTFSLGDPVEVGLTPFPNLTWNPGSTTWNYSNSNWLSGSSSAVFTDAGVVFFGTGSVGVVQIDAGGVSPSSVTIANSKASGIYTFTGGSINGGAAVVKSNSGTAIFTAANGYTGGTTIKGGVLAISGGDDRLGAPSGGITLDSGTLRTDSVGINSARTIFIDTGGGTFDSNGLDSTLSGLISGPGRFSKDGAGTLTLTSNNTFAGGMYINDGRLEIGNGGVTGFVPGTITNNAVLVINRSDDLVLSQELAGSGSTTKLGSGTLTLTYANSNSGVITISAGTLRIGNGGLGGSIEGDVVDNASLVFSHSNNSGFSHQISGSGSLTVTGGGQLTLTADTTYTGGTTINSGGLVLGNHAPAGTGSILGNVNIIAGSLTFDHANAFTFGGDISGSGSVIQIGPGMLTLTGTNTFTGTMNLNASKGAVSIGNGGTTGSIISNVSVGNTLIFNRANDVTYPGVISNEGQVIKLGSGMLTFSNNNTYTGRTTISAGTLRVGDGGATGAIVGSVVNQSLLIFDRSSNLTYANIISGSGAVIKNGSGTLTLSGVNTWTGGTTINAGTLQVSSGTTGAIAGNIMNDASLVFMHSSVNSTVDAITSSNSNAGATTVSSNTIVSAQRVAQATLSVAGTLTIRPNGGASGVSRVGTLSVTSPGKIDLGDNKLIATATPAGTWNGVSYTGITGLVQSGRNGNALPLWDGSTGIVTTQSSATGGNFTSIGVARASDVRSATASATALWAGQTITGTDTLVMYTYGGDANLDGKINIDDYARIDIGLVLGLTGWSNGDFNYDGKVNVDDYTMLIDPNISAQGAPFFASGSVVAGQSVTAVPEPLGGAAALVLLAGGIRRRQRNLA